MELDYGFILVPEVGFVSSPSVSDYCIHGGWLGGSRHKILPFTYMGGSKIMVIGSRSIASGTRLFLLPRPKENIFLSRERHTKVVALYGSLNSLLSSLSRDEIFILASPKSTRRCFMSSLLFFRVSSIGVLVLSWPSTSSDWGTWADGVVGIGMKVRSWELGIYVSMRRKGRDKNVCVISVLRSSVELGFQLCESCAWSSA